MSRDFWLNEAKIARIAYTQYYLEWVFTENGTVSKRPRAFLAEIDCGDVHCPTVGNKHWMFDPLSVNIHTMLFLHMMSTRPQAFTAETDCNVVQQWGTNNGTQS